MKDNFNTDQQIRQSLQEFEVVPDSQSFEVILQKMDKKRKRRAFMILFSLGFSMVLTGIIVSLFLYGKSRPNALLAHRTGPLSANIKQSWKEKEQSHSSWTLVHPHQDVLNATDKIIPSQIIQNPVGFTGSSAGPVSNVRVNHSAVSLSKFINTKSQSKDTFNRANDSTYHQVMDTILVSNAIQENLYEIAFISPLFLKDTIEPPIIERIIKITEPDSLLKRKKKNDLAFYIGVQGNPQINRFAFSKNPKRDRLYNTPDNFPGQYLQAKKDNANVQYSTSFGIKTGITIHQTYEFFVSFGYQKFKEKETINAGIMDTVQVHNDPGFASFQNNQSNEKNVFKSYYYSLEANRIFTSGKSLKFKTGLTLSVNQLMASDYFLVTPPNSYSYEVLSHTKLSSCLMTAKLKAGMIFHGNKRLQLHISPGVFYSVTSVFQNDYVIKQKPYGVDVECLLLFRLYRMPGR